MATSVVRAVPPSLSTQAHNIAGMIARLTVWHNDPHRFHEDRDKVRREAGSLARELERKGL